MSVSKIVGACGFLLVAAFAATASAQSQHIQLYQIQVKSGSEAEFTAFIKKLVEAADKTESSMEWLTAQGVLGTAGTKINYHPHSGWFNEGPSKGPFSARVQPKERGRVDARSLITYGA